MSLRRLRYQLRCAASGHDPRPRLVDGTTVEHRCLRCGAVVGDPEPVASGAHRPGAPAGEPHGPVQAGLPPTLPEPVAEPVHPADGNGAGEAEDDGLAALHALKELGELHAAGVVTDAEFETKKAELLRRV